MLNQERDQKLQSHRFDIGDVEVVRVASCIILLWSKRGTRKL